MRIYSLVEAGDPEAIDVYLCEQDARWDRRSGVARSEVRGGRRCGDNVVED
jgi:hypothetical protein